MEKNRIAHISNLYKSFDNKKVIDGISFSLYSGENLVVLGKSGTGKSVIMKCIVRLLEADSGSINVFGTEVTSCNDQELMHLRTRIGYLFQEGAMYDSMSVMENLLFPAKRNPKLKKMPEKELIELAEYNLESVGLIEAVDKLPAELSGGMKKRAGLARTLMLSPELIIYDEPTTGLDPITSEAIIDLMLKVNNLYKTSSIIITHDIKCAHKMGNRLIMIDNGMIIAEGTYKEFEKNPTEQVKHFFN